MGGQSSDTSMGCELDTTACFTATSHFPSESICLQRCRAMRCPPKGERSESFLDRGRVLLSRPLPTFWRVGFDVQVGYRGCKQHPKRRDSGAGKGIVPRMSDQLLLGGSRYRDGSFCERLLPRYAETAAKNSMNRKIAASQSPPEWETWPEARIGGIA